MRHARRRGRVGSPDPCTPCGYCFSRWAVVYDHILPWVGGGTDDPNNLYPACTRCNSVAGGLIFDSLEEKREYIRRRLIEKGQWNEALPRVQYPIRSGTTSEVLWPKVSMERVARKKSSHHKKRKAKPKRRLSEADKRERRAAVKQEYTEWLKNRRMWLAEQNHKVPSPAVPAPVPISAPVPPTLKARRPKWPCRYCNTEMLGTGDHKAHFCSLRCYRLFWKYDRVHKLYFLNQKENP